MSKKIYLFVCLINRFVLFSRILYRWKAIQAGSCRFCIHFYSRWCSPMFECSIYMLCLTVCCVYSFIYYLSQYIRYAFDYVADFHSACIILGAEIHKSSSFVFRIACFRTVDMIIFPNRSIQCYEICTLYFSFDAIPFRVALYILRTTNSRARKYK